MEEMNPLSQVKAEENEKREAREKAFEYGV
jgi:hypothetical protein